jgi:peroxiredoxin Q/BCP
LKIGEVVPNFILKNQNGIDFELFKNLDRPLLLVFYPKDNTPVCSKQLSNYNDNFDEFIRSGLNVVGISTDAVESHYKFCEKLKLNFPLLADKDRSVSKLFDAINIIGIHKRVLVLIGTDKIVKWKESTLGLTYINTSEILSRLNSLNIQ